MYIEEYVNIVDKKNDNVGKKLEKYVTPNGNPHGYDKTV